jgi:SanA protein
MHKMKKAGRTLILIIVLLIFISLALPRVLTLVVTQKHIYELDTAPSAQAAIVFGAGLNRNGTPSPILRDRVDTAVDLYLQGKVKKLVMSGSSDGGAYNEPKAMFDYAISLGVPANDIVLDLEGHRTYDTCFRAIHVYALQDVLLVTQRFHLPRAIFSCEHLGLNANGVVADRRRVFFENYVREIPATFVAVWEALISRPTLVVEEKHPIFPLEGLPAQKGCKEPKNQS